MDIEKNAHELIALIYDAALAPEKWQDVMVRLTQVVGTNTALLREVNYTKGKVGLYKTVGFDPAFTKAYREHFVHLDFFAPAIMREPIGRFTRGDYVLPWEKQRGTEFCNDYLLAQNNRYCLGILLARENDHHLLFALQRSKQQGDSTERKLHLLNTLAPHMTRAISIHRQMLTITTQQQWALSALDKLKIGIILLDDLGRPCFINQQAENLMSSGCGLSISKENVILTNPMESAHLQSFIVNAAKAANGHSFTAGGSLRATNHLGSALHIHVIPLPRDISERPWGLALPRGCVAIFISASGSTHLRAETLCALYGFTTAEAKLASLLVDGLSLDDAASTLGTSIQTVRSQLKAVFAKTQVSRQAELVALLLTDLLNHQHTH
jgi:DNA-binding CsgD family transcriptional regulator/PAS domain-containing protein